MRKTIPVLFGLGGFLLVAGLVCWLWAPGVVKKTPLDVNTTTHLSGQAQKLNTATGELDSNPVNATSITKTDSKASDDKIVVWANSSCLVIDKDNPPDCVDGRRPPPRLGQHRRVRHRPRDRAGCQRQQVPAGRRRRAPRTGQQVPLRHREEDLPLLGRHARQGRRREVRRHGQGQGRRHLRLQGRLQGRARSTSPRASRAPTPTRPRSTSSRAPVRSSTRPTTSSASWTAATRCSTCSSPSPAPSSSRASTTPTATSACSTWSSGSSRSWASSVGCSASASPCFLLLSGRRRDATERGAPRTCPRLTRRFAGGGGTTTIAR